MGVVGFLDDFIKIRKQRNLGLNKRMKFLGQTFVALSFGVGALFFRNGNDLTPASTELSYTRDLAFLSVGAVGFVILAWLLVAAWSNAVNFTDGLDGLAAGSSVMVLGTYVAIGFFQFRNACWAPYLDATPRRPAATTSATRSTWPRSPPRRSAAASGSSGGTRIRPGS